MPTSPFRPFPSAASLSFLASLSVEICICFYRSGSSQSDLLSLYDHPYNFHPDYIVTFHYRFLLHTHLISGQSPITWYILAWRAMLAIIADLKRRDFICFQEQVNCKLYIGYEPLAN